MKAVGMAGNGWQANTKPAEQNRCRQRSQRILRSAQASKKQGPQMASLAAKQQLPMLAASRRAGRRGSAVMLAAMKAGSDLPTLPLPHLSPLPVIVPTHSLNL